MMQSISAVEPLPQTRVRITWADGSESVIDLRPLLTKGGVFDVLADRARFEAVQIGERGRTLIWRDDEGDEIDLCADALWQMAHGGKVSAA
jgi:Protein of unknown function (DUF2442)